MPQFRKTYKKYHRKFLPNYFVKSICMCQIDLPTHLSLIVQNLWNFRGCFSNFCLDLSRKRSIICLFGFSQSIEISFKKLIFLTIIISPAVKERLSNPAPLACSPPGASPSPPSQILGLYIY